MKHGKYTAASLFLLLGLYSLFLATWGWNILVRQIAPGWFRWSSPDHFRIFLEHFGGPVYTVVFGVLLLVLACSGKRVPWWIALGGIPGVWFAAYGNRGLHHDLSHEMFDSCRGYSGTLFKLGMASGVLLLAHCLLVFLEQRKMIMPMPWGAPPEDGTMVSSPEDAAGKPV